MRSSREEVLSRVSDLGGMGAEQAERATRATLGALRGMLADDEAEALARELPEDLAEIVRMGAFHATYEPPELYEQARRREGVAIGFAAEHAQVVLSVLAAELPGELVERMRKHLHPATAELLAPRAAPPAPEAALHHPPVRVPIPKETLATGRAGSSHPLHEARPERAHAHSVARSDDPHADTKLSSARGLTQERLNESLATGHSPGPKRPLSGD